MANAAIFALSSEGTCVSTDRGQTWVLARADKGQDALRRLAYHKGEYRGANPNGEVFTAKAATGPWQEIGAIPLEGGDLQACAAEAETFFVGTAKGVIYTSSDGKSWARANLGVATPGPIQQLEVWTISNPTDARPGSSEPQWIDTQGTRALMSRAGSTWMIESGDHGKSWHEIHTFPAAGCEWNGTPGSLEIVRCEQQAYAHGPSGSWEGGPATTAGVIEAADGQLRIDDAITNNGGGRRGSTCRNQATVCGHMASISSQRRRRASVRC